MSADKVSKLQDLLGRIQRNAALPRPVRAAAAPAPAEAEEPEEVVAFDEEMVAEPQEPAVVAAPIDDDAPAIEVATESIDDLDLLEADIVDITDEPPPVEFDEVEEIEPPASSRRPKAAASMSEALAGAAEQLDLEGREIPLKTPPPESGPQEAPPIGLGSPPLPEDLDVADDVDELLATPSDGPTPEQLGATVDLEESVSGVIEIAEDRTEIIEPVPAQPVAPQPPAAQPPAANVPLQPEITERPAVAADASPAAFASREAFSPESFLELLDASLGL